MDNEYAGKFETGAIAPVTPHLKFLDGLRGVAALYVVLNHSRNLSYAVDAVPQSLYFLGWGRAAVTIFIAISGYCLALPVVRSGLALKGGGLHFYQKRARRILPPYYVALALGVIVELFLASLHHPMVFWSDPLNRKGLFAHLFLAQNWLADVEFTFNGPLWSVAMEVQIYLFFPVMVLIWRRFGIAWMLAGTFIFSVGVYFLTGHRGPADYLFIFALGVWAAQLSFGKLNLLALKVAFFACLLAFLAPLHIREIYTDLIVGVGAASLMAVCARTSFWPHSLLSLSFFTWLGSFSYSLYLVHGPIQDLFVGTLAGRSWIGPGLPTFLFSCFVLTPIIVGLSYVFHLTIERPFMTVHKVRTAAKTPLTSPEGISA